MNTETPRRPMDLRTNPDANQALIDETDANIDLALRGDRDAAGWVAVRFSAALVEEAMTILGPDLTNEAVDVVQELCQALLEGSLYFRKRRAAGVPFLLRMVRRMARAVKKNRKATARPGACSVGHRIAVDST